MDGLIDQQDRSHPLQIWADACSAGNESACHVLKQEAAVAAGMVGGALLATGGAEAAAALASVASNGYGFAASAAAWLNGLGLRAANWLESGGASQEGSVAEQSAVPFLESNAAHIFRNASGHFSADTAESRAIHQGAVNSSNSLGVDQWGKTWYARTLDTGLEVWAHVTNGYITNGGINSVAGTAAQKFQR